MELPEKILTPDVACQTDPVYWACHRGLVVDGQTYSMDGRTYQFEIMRPVTDDGKTKMFEVIRKGSQIGITICMVMEICHGALYELYPHGIIYYFPSKTSVELFSAGRFKPFVRDNQIIKKAIKGKTDAVYLRRIGKVNVNFLGGSATSRVGGDKKDSAAVRSTPADWVLLDERDIFDDEMAKQVNQRLGDSKIYRRTDLGTPTIPDFGVDRLYKKSDMRRWQIKCECGKHTCLETEFPNCIKLDDNGVGYPACIHCGLPLDRNKGKWVPDSPEKDNVGYWPSQLLNPNRNLAMVLRQLEDPEAYDMDEAEFYRTVLGMPFISTEDALSESDVMACCGRDIMQHSHNGPCAMGVDVHPNMLYVVIGHRTDNDRYKLVKLARIPVKGDWGGLHDIAHRFNVKSCVIDAMPETNMGRAFQRDERFAVNLCYYSEHLKAFTSWNDDGIVTVKRTDIFDESHNMVSTQRIEIPRVCEEVKIFAHQMTQSVKILDTDLRTGVKTYRYIARGDKEDHYRNAVNYFYLACRKVGIPTSYHRRREMVTTQDMEYRL